jgi:hypothetical protein
MLLSPLSLVFFNKKRLPSERGKPKKRVLLFRATRRPVTFKRGLSIPVGITSFKFRPFYPQKLPYGGYWMWRFFSELKKGDLRGKNSSS